MQFPDFFTSAPVIRLRDPLAEFLGAAKGGIIEYRYEDAVRLAGHSCPTVASAFLMTRAAVAALYCEQIPMRGWTMMRRLKSPPTCHACPEIRAWAS